MKAASPETAVRRMIVRYNLDRVEIVSGGQIFIAIAYPAAWSTVVGSRRRAAFAAIDGASLSIAEATTINDKAAADAVGRASGGTISGALAKLADVLKTLPTGEIQ